MEILRSAHKYWLMPAFRWKGLDPVILILLHTSLGQGIEDLWANINATYKRGHT